MSSRRASRATRRSSRRTRRRSRGCCRRTATRTAAFGKWHLTPDHQQGPAGPFDRWPNRLGFDYFWGFLGGEAGQYDPVITENQTTIGPPEEEELLPARRDDRQDDRVAARRAGAGARTSRGSPTTRPAARTRRTTSRRSGSRQVQGPRSTRAGTRYREETFERQKQLGVIPADAELTPRNEAFPAWDSVPRGRSGRCYARQMEVFAGFLENADWNVGRVLDAIEEMGELDNTLVIYIWGDNGASMEGSAHRHVQRADDAERDRAQRRAAARARSSSTAAWRRGAREIMAPHYAAAWAWAGNCPFQWGKQVASHLGGTRNPMVVQLAARDRASRAACAASSRTSSTSARRSSKPPASRRRRSIDGIEQTPMHGTSFLYSLRRRRRARAPHPAVLRDLRQPRDVQGRLVASWMLPRIPWDADAGDDEEVRARRLGPRRATRPSCTTCPTTSPRRATSPPSTPRRSRSCESCSGRRPRSTTSLPLLGGLTFYFGIVPPLGERTTFTYYGDVQNVASGMIPRIYNHSYTISADLEIPAGGAEGVIVAEADHLGGFSLFVQDGKLRHTYSLMGVRVFRQVADAPLPTGSVNVRLEFAADAAQPGDRRRGDAVRQRRAGRRRPDGPHRPVPLLRLRRHGHRPRQRPAGRPRLRRQIAVRVHRHDQARSSSTSIPSSPRKTAPRSTSTRSTPRWRTGSAPERDR